MNTKQQNLKCECGNIEHFRIWTEFEYSDGSGEPNTSNQLIEVEYIECLDCGEFL